jgi:small subunit ribosomal protein S16
VAVKLRLVRMGKKKQPTYRVVAADSRSPRDGRFLEVVGTYAPRGRSRSEPAAIVTIDHERAIHWLRQGAKPTDRVERLLRDSGTLDRMHGVPVADAATEAAGPEEAAPNAGPGAGADEQAAAPGETEEG